MTHLTSYFKGLADEKRLRILNLLFQGELCGCDIQHVLDASQSNVSRHLSYLKNAGLVTDRRLANRVYYKLARSEEPGMAGLLAFLESALGDSVSLQKDRKKLLSAIKDGSCSVSEAPKQEARRPLTRPAHRTRKARMPVAKVPLAAH